MNMVGERSMKKEKETGVGLAMRVSRETVIINVILSIGKLLAGIIGKSGAMISDAVHSVSDVFSTFVVMAGIKLADKEEDTEHPYGHERMECVAAIILAVFLATVGVGIGFSGGKKIIGGNYDELTVPGISSLIAAVVSIIVKEWMFWYTKAAAKKINSGALMADAWHHRSDAMSSVGAFVGILFSRLGMPIMDPIASVVISVLIVKAAYDIFRDGLDKMIDRSCDAETEERMRGLVTGVDGVMGINSLKTRLFGAKIYVDVEIFADGELSLTASHEIAQKVHDAIEESFSDCKHCMVHVDPAPKPDVDEAETNE